MLKKSLSILLALIISVGVMIITPSSATIDTPMGDTSEIVSESNSDNPVETAVSDEAVVVKNGIPDNADELIREAIPKAPDEDLALEKADLAATGAEYTSGYYKYTPSGSNASITGYIGSGGVVTIPSKLEGYNVTAISDSAFRGNTKLTSLTIPDSVESLGINAFRDCTALKTLKIGGGVTYMGYTSTTGSGVFQGCTALETVTITSGTKVIGCSAFSGCISLTSVTIPSTVEYIYRDAFLDCTVLKSVTIPTSVRKIEGYAFCNCKSMTSLSFATNGKLEAMGESAFRGCVKLTNITIPDSVESLGINVFRDCTALKTLKIGGGVTYMGYTSTTGSGVFQGCTALETVTITSGTKLIGCSAFSGCISLTSVTIPSTVEYIYRDAFLDCTVLKSVTIPTSVRKIEGYAFCNCKSMTSLSFATNGKLEAMGESAFRGCVKLTNITIPDSVESLGINVFRDCTALKTLKIGGGVTYMGYTSTTGSGVFQGCTALETVTITSGTKVIGCSAFSGCISLTSVTIPSTVEYIYRDAFLDCTVLKSVTIPTSVRKIEGYAFCNCKSMTSLSFATNGKIEAIDESAFRGCVKLTNITIPDSVESLGTNAFRDCTGLKTLKIGGGVTYMGYTGTTGYGVFQGCTALETVTIISGTKVIGCSAFKDCRNLTRIDIPESVVSIGSVNNTSSNLADSDVFKNHSSSLVIYGKTNSFAHKFANANNIPFNEIVPSVIPTGLSLNTYSKTLELGEEYQLIATVTPSDANDKSVKWWSGDESIAKVSNAGLVKANGSRLTNSTATIYAQTSNGITKTCTIKVIVYPKGISLNKDRLDLYEGESEQLEVTYDPSYTNVRNLTWKSKDPTIVEVDNNGKVTAKNIGTTTVTAQTENGKVYSCFVEVSKKTYAQKYGWCLSNYDISYGYDNDNSWHMISRDAYHDAYGISIPNLIYRDFDRLHKWSGYCFGLSLLSLGQYYGKIDLKPYFSTDGEYLYDFGYDTIYTTSNSKQCFSIAGNEECISLIERAFILQDSFEFKRCEIFKNDSDYSDIIDFLNSENAKPILVNVSGAIAHTMVITTDYKPEALGDDWYKIPVYDSNAPANSKLLTNPASYYTRTPSYLKVNVKTSRWQYYLNDELIDYSSYYSFNYPSFRSIFYYDVSKLQDSFFRNRIDIPTGTTILKISGKSVRISTSDNKLLFELVNGKCFYIDESFIASVISNGDEWNNEPQYMISTDRSQLRFESEDAEVLAISDENIFMTELNSSFNAEMDFETGKISGTGIDDNGNTLIAVSNSATEQCVKISAQSQKNGYSSLCVADNGIQVRSSDKNAVVESEGDSQHEYNCALPGDVNDDGSINMKDIVLLQQYLNDWNITINESSADVTDDGSINMKDIVLLQQHLNDWDVVLK